MVGRVITLANSLTHLQVKGSLVWNSRAHIILIRRLDNRKNSNTTCSDNRREFLRTPRHAEESSADSGVAELLLLQGVALGREEMALLPQGWATGTDENGRVYCECLLMCASGSVADSS